MQSASLLGMEAGKALVVRWMYASYGWRSGSGSTPSVDTGDDGSGNGTPAAPPV